MYINNQSTTQPQFKGIDKKIIQNLGSYSRGVRESIARNYNTLEKSDIIDLTCDTNNSLVLKTKKHIKNILKGNQDLPEGSTIKITGTTRPSIDGATVTCPNMYINEKETNDLILRFGLPELAQDSFKTIALKSGDTYEDKLPQIGSLIDATYKITEPINAIKRIMSETLFK